MKRIFSIFLILSLFTVSVFADDEGDEYDDGYVYEMNGAGDQFLKIGLSAIFPVNFEGKLYPGVAAELGYYRFLSSWLAVGGELGVSSQFSVGGKALFMVPIVFGTMFQPTAGKFEFPIYTLVGVGNETWANATYFPSLVVKASAGAYYRITESWSAGINGSFMWIPQWTEDKKKDVNGIFSTVALGARYHF